MPALERRCGLKTEIRESRGRRRAAKTVGNAFFKKAAWLCTCVRGRAVIRGK